MQQFNFPGVPAVGIYIFYSLTFFFWYCDEANTFEIIPSPAIASKQNTANQQRSLPITIPLSTRFGVRNGAALLSDIGQLGEIVENANSNVPVSAPKRSSCDPEAQYDSHM